jgi:hypothetical protein
MNAPISQGLKKGLIPFEYDEKNFVYTEQNKRNNNNNNPEKKVQQGHISASFWNTATNSLRNQLRLHWRSPSSCNARKSHTY